MAREQGNVWISENRLPGYLNMIIATDNHLERILEKKSEYSAVSDVLSDEFSTF